MQRFLEKILGLKDGFLKSDGDFSLQFNPHWPGQDMVGVPLWNFMLGLLAVGIVVWVYRREGKSAPVRVSLAALRLLLLGFIIALLNNPVIRLTQTRNEASVVAVLIDDTRSLSLKDEQPDPKRPPITRMEALMDLLNGEDQKLIHDLGKQHNLRFYRFNRDAQEIAEIYKGEMDKPAAKTDADTATTQPSGKTIGGEKVAKALAAIKPEANSTQVIASLRGVLDDLQGQRLAGVVLLTDGRSTPAEDVARSIGDLKTYGAKVFPVAVGSTNAPRDLAIEALNVQDSVFVDDIANMQATVRGTGYPKGHKVRVIAKNKDTGLLLKGPDGKECEQIIELNGEENQKLELPFKPEKKGDLNIVLEIDELPGSVILPQDQELDKRNNTRPVQVAVLDSQIRVLYVDGYPRWEYRYLARQLIRDKTIDVSCILLSADEGFAQECDTPNDKTLKYFPYKAFPETMEQLMETDVVVFGDVDERRFTQRQLELVHEFVAKKGGGFGMVAGPRWAPAKFKGTKIADILPVNITDVPDSFANEKFTEAWRPIITREGEASGVFRFFTDKQANDKYLKEDLQPLFWYCRGARVKPGVGEVYAEHPTDKDRHDGRLAPILVMGRYGAGRTMFSAVDDSWRWRYYTGEQIFDSYWVQQLRYLARSKKLGERKYMFAIERPVYELNKQVKLKLRVLDTEKLQQLPQRLPVEVVEADKATDGGGKAPLSSRQTLVKTEGESDLYEASWTADTIGRFVVKLPSPDGTGVSMDRVFEVLEPRQELTEPQVDLRLLTNVAAETGGEVVAYKDARTKLPTLIKSRDLTTEIHTNEAIWDAPLALVIFVLLITVEWVLRKVYGML